VEDKQKIYRKKLIKFPAPKFFVLYDGDQKEPLTRKMKLSDAFGGDSTSLELIVTTYNINHGLNQPLLQKCDYLNEYSILVGKVKEGIKAGLIGRDAIANAVKFCITNGIMKGYLENHSEEVFNMLALQWDKDSAMKASYDDGKEDGLNEGLKKGQELGQNQAIESVAVNMILDNEPIEKICKFTKLSLERIKELAALCKD
jgi:hypothetical protein